MSILESRPQSEALTKDRAATAPTVAGWFDDPDAQHNMRYFDGTAWTQHVTHFGPSPCSGCG
jgi:hypothetical protein